MVRKKLKRETVLRSVLIAFMTILILTFYIWRQAESVKMGYSIRDLEEKVARLEKEVETLEAKKTSLLSLDRVEQRAKQNLGLREPKEEQLIYKEFGDSEY
ncbi:MAG: cell division protein FtsL [Candidatus Aminicenantes bacterium]|nr:cell division protein FtsL [Candidatus Aminicenantes bacterium]